MYFVLYDRHLNSLGETYVLETWSRKQRAVDFDDIRITGEQIPYSVDPFFVVINDRQGHQQFSGLASTPTIDDKSKKTTIVLKDYTTLFNTEIVVDWSKFPTDGSLSDYFNLIFTAWLEQTDVGFTGITWDVTRLAGKLWDNSNLPLGTDTESVVLHDLFIDALIYYKLYCTPVLDVYAKTLTFVFHVAGVRSQSIRLRDFGILTVEKSFGSHNRVSIYNHKYQKKQSWALTETNDVVKLPSSAALVYPAKNKNFVADAPDDSLTETQALYNAVYDAVMELAKNRYQENIDLDVQQYTSLMDMSQLDFSDVISVYTDGNFYKSLPVGEIETDSKGKHIIRLGHNVQELTQEI